MKQDDVEQRLRAAEALAEDRLTLLSVAGVQIASLKAEAKKREEKFTQEKVDILRQLAFAQAQVRESQRCEFALLKALVMATESGQWVGTMTKKERDALPVTLKFMDADKNKEPQYGTLSGYWSGDVEAMAGKTGPIAGNVEWRRNETSEEGSK